MSAHELISIITPCLDRATCIEDAVRSVLTQGDEPFEHIVVDGGSTDGTREILARYPHLTVQSRRDAGMYEALNRGLALARGDIVGFLNSDDVYEVGALAEVRARLHRTQAAIAGAAEFFTDRDGRRQITFTCSPHEGSALERAVTGSPAFNAWFFRRDVFARLGHFDPGYRIAGDREFMLRFALARLPYATTPRVLYRYRQHAGSLTMGGRPNLDAMLDEHLRLTGANLRDAALARETRALLVSARTRDTLDGVARAVRVGRWSDALRYARAGCDHDPAWLLKFARRGLRALARRGGLIPAGVP
jgi:glycosyltransferase involved in cell wall biosynthesis